MSEVDPTDLVCQARRHLSGGQPSAIDLLLRRSPEARLANLLLQGFEGESSVQRGDDALAQRMVNGAITRLRRPGVQRQRRHMLSAAALVLLVAGAATAWRANRQLIVRASSRADPAVSVASSQVPKRVRTSGTFDRAALTPVTAEPSLEGAEPAPNPSVTIAIRPRVGPTAATVAQTTEERVVASSAQKVVESASELFTRANLARRQGQRDDAIALYRKLLESYPSAPEALPGRLALAKLLAGSQPTMALEQYQLLAGIAGPLQAEALWGVVELARQRGKNTLEQRAGSELVKRFPDSPYADVARERLVNGAP